MNALKFFLVLFIISGACACSIPMPFMTPQSVSPDVELFSRAERLFERKDYAKANALYDEYLTRYSDRISAPLALMREASINIEQKKPTAARKMWQYLMKTYPESVFVPEARIGILGSLYEERAYSEVIKEGDTILKSIPTYHPRVRTIMGDAYLALNLPGKAIEAYSLAATHAVSSEKEEIRKKLKSAVSLLSEGELTSLNEQSGYNSLLKGHLMYQLGLRLIKADKHDAAVKILSELTDILPQHETVSEAKLLIKRFKKQEEKPVEVSSPALMPPQQPIQGQSSYKIGCLLPLSGSFAAYGSKALKGIELAKQKAMSLGFQPIDIVVRDSGVTPDQALQAVKEADEQQVSAIIGPLTVADIAAAEARTRGIPMIMLIQKSNADTGNYLFRHFITPETQVEAVVRYAVSAGLRNFAVLYPNEKYGSSFSELFRQSVTAHGGRIVGTAAYPPNQTDFSSSLKKLAQNPFDALFIPDTAKKVGLILPQMAFHNMPNVRLFGTNLWHSDKLIQAAGKYADGAVIPDGFFAESQKPAVKEFVLNFQAAYKEKPEFIEAIAYDTAMMLFQILGKPGVHTRNEVRDQLLRLQYFQGVTGTTSFDPRGEAIKKPYLLRVDGNSFVEIETP